VPYNVYDIVPTIVATPRAAAAEAVTLAKKMGLCVMIWWLRGGMVRSSTQYDILSNVMLSPTTNTCLHMDVSRYILVSTCIHVVM
jgi:hypothetical protein